jgi:hypothetical protein
MQISNHLYMKMLCLRRAVVVGIRVCVLLRRGLFEDRLVSTEKLCGFRWKIFGCKPHLNGSLDGDGSSGDFSSSATKLRIYRQSNHQSKYRSITKVNIFVNITNNLMYWWNVNNRAPTNRRIEVISWRMFVVQRGTHSIACTTSGAHFVHNNYWVQIRS